MTWTARQIWKSMTNDQRLAAAEALFSDERLDRMQRLQALAPWLVAQGMRPQFLETLPRARRAALLARGGVPEETAAQLLLSLHIVARRPLLTLFLDQLGIKHEGGLVDGEEALRPDPAKLPQAIAAVRKEFPPADVELYFLTLLAADPDAWQGLASEVPAAG